MESTRDDGGTKKTDKKNTQTNKIELIEEAKALYENDISNNTNPDYDSEIETILYGNLLSVEPDSSENKSLIDDDKESTDTDNESSGYFGYDFFSADPELFQNSFEEVIDPNYLIGPGDEVIVMLWGETEINQEYIVTKEGYLFIENVGQVFVNGITLKELEKKLFKLLKKVYSTLDPTSGKASTFFDVSLGSQVLRPLRVFALGEVESPGAYSLKSTATLFSSLYYFNGPTINGSLRHIQLMRNGKLIKEVDFYKFLLTGKKSGDVKLQRDDVIFIPKRKKTVTVNGQINRPSIYELKEKESFSDLIEIAGGLTAETYAKRAQINRIIPFFERDSLSMDRTLIDIELEEFLNSKNKVELFDKDIVEFFSISDEKRNVVSINGSITRPGEYGIDGTLSLVDLISKADGLLANTYLDRADITRKSDDGSLIHVDVDLKKALVGDENHNIKLVSGDEITIYNLGNMLYTTNVSINGHVVSPVDIPLRKGMQVIDLIFMGGGFKNDEHLSNTYFKRAELSRYNEDYSTQYVIPFNLDSVLAGKDIAYMELEMGDNIRIYSNEEVSGVIQNEISIEGFVKRAGVYTLFDDMKLRDLLFMAGGLEDDFHFNETFLGRADIIRFKEDYSKKIIIPFSLLDVLDTNKNYNPILKAGDIVRIYSKRMFEYIPKVSIEGSIQNAGEYDLKDNMSIKDLILEAGGVSADIYRFRVDVATIDPYNMNINQYSNVKSFQVDNNHLIYKLDDSNLEDRLKTINEKLNYKLEPYDLVTIRPDPYFQKQAKVLIEGFIYYPGEYVLRYPGEKITDIIDRAGGLKEEAYPHSSKLIRAGEEIGISFDKIIKNPKSKMNFAVAEGDQIKIGSRPNLVRITGAVNTPGNYQYIRGYRLDDYIKLAGGYSKDASRFSSFVVYPYGKTEKVRLFTFSPIVLDGSVISVGTKEEVDRFNFTEYVTNLTTVWADITQAYLMIVLAMRN
tara:strand:- start:4389 stop:7286 length:2898 start_codon:yes stop_codon:yes gene_type:complete